MRAATSNSARRLPTVVATSVIRSATKGHSHGGVYLVDLDSAEAALVIDWDTADIDWEGRGGDRGLRGVAFSGQRAYLAASDELFIFDTDFRRLGSITNPYLKHCHEIDIDGDALYLTSTGFDSVLRYDITDERFTDGYQLRYERAAHLWNRLLGKVPAGSTVGNLLPPRPTFRRFDPNKPGGPTAGDTCHLNSVTTAGGAFYVSGTQLRRLYEIREGRMRSYARVPAGTHNARPFRDGVIMNATEQDVILVAGRQGRTRRRVPITVYDPSELRHTELATGQARQAFGRGLTIHDDRYLLAGSSPATISVFDLSDGSLVKAVNLTMDVRNAVHGLEVWPFVTSPGGVSAEQLDA